MEETTQRKKRKYSLVTLIADTEKTCVLSIGYTLILFMKSYLQILERMQTDSLNVTIQGPFLIHYKKDVLYNGKKISLWDNADYGLKMDFYDRFREVKDNIYHYKGGMDTIAFLDQQVLTLIIVTILVTLSPPN